MSTVTAYNYDPYRKYRMGPVAIIQKMESLEAIKERNYDLEDEDFLIYIKRRIGYEIPTGDDGHEWLNTLERITKGYPHSAKIQDLWVLYCMKNKPVQRNSGNTEVRQFILSNPKYDGFNYEDE